MTAAAADNGSAASPGRGSADLGDLDRALIEETAKKSALLWVRGPGGPARALWHVWHEGAVCLVGRAAPDSGPDSDPGRTEQPLTGLGLADGGTATVTARSKDKGGRLVAWPARVVELTPGSEQWQATAEELKGKRLNTPDADTVLDRWSRECRLLRLEPAGAPTQTPAGMPDASHAAPPLPTPATTRRRAPAGLPRLLFRRKRRSA